MSFYPQISNVSRSTKQLKAFINTDIEVKYRDTSGVNSGVKQVTADSIKLDLTNGFNEQILTGSVRFKQVMILLLIAPALCIEILIQATEWHSIRINSIWYRYC
jgi:hypothetical protein